MKRDIYKAHYSRLLRPTPPHNIPRIFEGTCHEPEVDTDASFRYFPKQR